jgi:dTDP-4-dehydrorhamnose reductase
MKILITGANGFLGQHLCRFLKVNHSICATGRGGKRLPFADVKYYPCDITDINAVKQLLSAVQPEVIIHAAAMSKPDECDTNRELCDRINVLGTRHFIDAAELLNHQPHFIYISTDFVFGNGGPHDEEAVPAPLNYYGESKWKAEQVTSASSLLSTIVRPVFMYGETWEGMRQTFLHWVKQSLSEGKSIKVVSDQVRTPTYVGDICKGIASIIDKQVTSLYHLAGEDRLSPYDMAVHFARFAGLDESLIIPVTAETFKEPVERAKEGAVKVDKAKRELGFKPISFQEGMKKIFNIFI